jgi:hypothetical protein
MNKKMKTKRKNKNKMKGCIGGVHVRGINEYMTGGGGNVMFWKFLGCARLSF